MTPQQLRTLIDGDGGEGSGDAQAKALAFVADDVGLAARLTLIAGPVPSPVPVLVGRTGMLKIFGDAGRPFGAGLFCKKLQALADGGPLLKPFGPNGADVDIQPTLAIIADAMKQDGTGIDIANPLFLAQLQAFVLLDVGGITQPEVDIVTAAAMVRPTVTPAEAGAAR